MHKVTRILAVVLILAIFGCGQNVAPIASSEAIAQSMMNIAAKKGYSSPLTSKQAVEVLTQGFDDSGYSYSATLRKFSSEGVSFGDPEKYKFTAFMLMPLMVMKKGDRLENYYSGDDLKAVKELSRMTQIVN